MKKPFNNYKDYITLLMMLISQHSLSTVESHALKNARIKLMFELIYYLREKLSEDAFKSLIMESNECDLYCHSQLSINELKERSKYEDIFLCTSKERNSYSGWQAKFGYNAYRHQYRIKLKSGRFGIDVNKIYSIFSEKEIINFHRVLYTTHISSELQFIHENEQEVIININDIDFYEEY